LLEGEELTPGRKFHGNSERYKIDRVDGKKNTRELQVEEAHSDLLGG